MKESEISRYTLHDKGCSARFLSLGCILQDWQVQHESGVRHVVLGYENPDDYLTNPHYLGAVIGRVANRVSNAEFELNGLHHLTRNEGKNHLHGGTHGLHGRVWDTVQISPREIQFKTESPDGDEGYPGAVKFCVTVRLHGQMLSYEMEALPDRPSPINMTQHSYFNLSGEGDLSDHQLVVNARKYTPVDDAGLPTGAIAALPDELNFHSPKPVGDKAIDINYALASGQHAARLWGGGLRLEVCTDQPGLQVYTGASLATRATPLAGQSHDAFSGIALEPQGYPDAVNQPGFPSIIATPDIPYRHRITLKISDAEAGS